MKSAWRNADSEGQNLVTVWKALLWWLLQWNHFAVAALGKEKESVSWQVEAAVLEHGWCYSKIKTVIVIWLHSNNPTPYVRSMLNEKEKCMGQAGKARYLGFMPARMKLLLFNKPITKSLWSFLNIILKPA